MSLPTGFDGLGMGLPTSKFAYQRFQKDRFNLSDPVGPSVGLHI